MPHRVREATDPRRCQGAAPDGQCWNEAAYGCDKCEVHGGRSTELVEGQRMYHLTEARNRQRLAQLQDEHDPLRSLREVIALARRLAERRSNLALADNADLINAIPPINALLLTIERIRRSAAVIEQNLDVLLSKPTVLKLGRLIIQIVIDELQGIENYEQITLAITTQITNAARSANNQTIQRNTDRPERPCDQDVRLFLIDNADDAIRIAELSGHERAKTLKDEIDLCIILIEARWNMIKSDIDLIQAVPTLNNQLKTLEKLVRSSHEFEQIVGNLLSVETQQKFAKTVGQVIIDELKGTPGYEEIFDKIMERIIDTLFNKPPVVEQKLLEHPGLKKPASAL